MLFRVLMFNLAAVLLLGCGEPFTAATTGAQSGATTGTPVPPGSGCSDGSREAFVDTAKWPNLAGCSGGFEMPGLAAGTALAPACDRSSGDSSDNPTGIMCTAADLCADDWHVCGSSDEVAAASETGCDPTISDAFFATRQSQTSASPGVCSAPPATNNLVGCGTIGRPVDASCAPLNSLMEWDNCLTSQIWNCGTDQDLYMEAKVVFKTGPEQGGVLCCRDAI